MSNFKTIDVHGKKHVVKNAKRVTSHFTSNGEKTELIPEANYRGTGMCLCGILGAKQKLSDFIYNYKYKGKKQIV
jgi:hypothetical protein